MKSFVFFIIFVFSYGLAEADEPHCTISDYGIVGAIPISEKTVPDAGSVIGTKRKVIGTISFSSKTTKIPAHLNIRFGVKHKFENVPDGEWLQWVIKHPPIKSSTGEYKTVSILAKNPMNNGSSYKFDTPEEVKAGRWLFQFLHKDSVLCEKAFDVYAE